jgi:hypothetical protein
MVMWLDGKVLGGNPSMEDGLWWTCQRKERVGERRKEERDGGVGRGRLQPPIRA